jgi:hypothetical protein
MKIFLVFVCLLLFGIEAQAQVMAPGAMVKCFLHAEAMAVLKKYDERAMFSGTELGTGYSFTWYLNYEKATSSYVTFPSPGIACIGGGEKVRLAKREGDL